MGVDESECCVPIADGSQFLVFPSYEKNEAGVDYLRFVGEDGEELLYYDHQEWVDDPQLVLGAIMACIQNGVQERKEFPK